MDTEIFDEAMNIQFEVIHIGECAADVDRTEAMRLAEMADSVKLVDTYEGHRGNVNLWRVGIDDLAVGLSTNANSPVDVILAAKVEV